MTSRILSGLGLALILLSGTSPVVADEAAKAVGDAIGSGVGELVADWHRQRQQIAAFNRRYFDLKRRVESCNGCPDEANLRAQFNDLKFQVDLDYALNYDVVPSSLGMSRQMKDISTRYLKSLGRMGEGIKKECASRHTIWSRCLVKHIGKVVFNPLVMQKRQVQAILSCPISYRKYVECRDNTPLDLTGDEIRQYWKEFGKVRPNGQVAEYYQAMRNDLTDYLVDLYAYQADVIRLLIIYGEAVLEPAAEQFRKNNGKYPRHFEALANRLLQQKIKARGHYAHRVPANLAVLSGIVEDNKELVWQRYRQGPPLAEFVNMNEYNVREYARSIYYWKRWPDRKPWLEVLARQSILVCNYPDRIAYHWYRSDPRDKAPITGLPNYLIDKAVSQCPEAPGPLAVFRYDKDLQAYLGTHPVKPPAPIPAPSVQPTPATAPPQPAARGNTASTAIGQDEDSITLLTLDQGYYRVEGRSPAGRPYRGTCRLRKTGKNRYRFLWSVGASYVGNGRVEGKIVTVHWGSDKPVIYRIQEDGILLGTWAGGKATENLYPVPSK